MEKVVVSENVVVDYRFSENQKVDLGRAVYLVWSWEDSYNPIMTKAFHRLEDAIEYAKSYVNKYDTRFGMRFDMVIQQEMIQFMFDDTDNEEDEDYE
jgi:hypothetical protein